MTCSCGFKFAGPGEFRNCQAFIDKDGNSWIICPKCGKTYVQENKECGEVVPKSTPMPKIAKDW